MSEPWYEFRKLMPVVQYPATVSTVSTVSAVSAVSAVAYAGRQADKGGGLYVRNLIFESITINEAYVVRTCYKGEIR